MSPTLDSSARFVSREIKEIFRHQPAPPGSSRQDREHKIHLEIDKADFPDAPGTGIPALAEMETCNMREIKIEAIKTPEIFAAMGLPDLLIKPTSLRAINLFKTLFQTVTSAIVLKVMKSHVPTNCETQNGLLANRIVDSELQRSSTVSREEKGVLRAL